MIYTRHLISLVALGAAAVAFSAALAADEPKAPATTRATTQPATHAATQHKPPVKPERPKIDEAYSLEFYKEHLPEAYEFVMMVKSKDPKAYHGKFKQEIINDTTRLYNIKANKAAQFPGTIRDCRLTFRSVQLSKEIRTPAPGKTEAELAQLRKELTDVATEQFEVRQELRKLQLAELENRFEALKKQLESTRKEINDREQAKAAAIEKHVKNMLLPKPRMEW